MPMLRTPWLGAEPNMPPKPYDAMAALPARGNRSETEVWNRSAAQPAPREAARPIRNRGHPKIKGPRRKSSGTSTQGAEEHGRLCGSR